jgi:hypothetical protein
VNVLDGYVWLAPLLLLPLVGLLGFVGCNQVLGLEPTVELHDITFKQVLGSQLEMANTMVVEVGFTGQPVAGNLMLVWVWYHTDSNQQVATITDSLGNTFERASAPVPGVGSLANHRQEAWFAKNIAGGSADLPTLTVTFTGVAIANLGVNVFEYVNASAESPIASVGQATGSGPTAAVAFDAPTFVQRAAFATCVFAGQGRNEPGANQRLIQRGNVAEDYLGRPLPLEATFAAVDPATQDWLAQVIVLQ